MSTRSWVVILLVAGIAIRVGLWNCCETLTSPDTGTYLAAAQDLVDGHLSRSEGRRTPGYPLLIALANGQAQAIVLFQMLGGLLTSLLLFDITIQMSRRADYAFLAGMTYNLNLQQLFLEKALYSESISTLSIVAVVAVSIRACRRLREDRPAAAQLMLLGLVAGVAIMVRPQFVFLPLLVAGVVGYASWISRKHIRRTLVHACMATAPAVMIIVAWAAFVFSQTGFFTMSTQTGFGLVNHSVAFVELAPDRYATLRTILLKYRDIKLAEQGHYGNTGWLAWPEIRAATGMSLPAASRELQKMSGELFLAHPFKYARSVTLSWIDFWTVPIFWQVETTSPPWLGSALRAAWWVEHKLLRIVNLAFVLLVLGALVTRRVRDLVQWDLDLTNIAGLVLLSSVVQALADYGASSRYLVTTQILVLYVVMTAWFRAKAGKAPALGAARPAARTS